MPRGVYFSQNLTSLWTPQMGCCCRYPNRKKWP